jgi:hypothetical protein
LDAAHEDLLVISSEESLKVEAQYTIVTEAATRGRSTWTGTCDFILRDPSYPPQSGTDEIAVSIHLASGSETLDLEVSHLNVWAWDDPCCPDYSLENISAAIVLGSETHSYEVGKQTLRRHQPRSDHFYRQAGITIDGSSTG